MEIGERKTEECLYLAPRKTEWYYNSWNVSTNCRRDATKSVTFLRQGNSCSKVFVYDITWNHLLIVPVITSSPYCKERWRQPEKSQLFAKRHRDRYLNKNCLFYWVKNYISAMLVIKTSSGSDSTNVRHLIAHTKYRHSSSKVRKTNEQLETLLEWVNHERRTTEFTHGLKSQSIIQPLILLARSSSMAHN